ncbi:MAG: hypothetical protein ACE5D7_05130 [Fidelibacterota bacterium]
MKFSIVFLISLFTFYSKIFAQNFSYVEGDWEIKTSPTIINAMTENTWEVYFATDDGIYILDKMNKSISFGFSMSHNLGSNNIFHLYYDPFSDFIWTVHENGISYKPAIGSYWTDVTIPFSPYSIQDIGSTDDGIIWLDIGSRFFMLDATSGTEREPDEFTNSDFVQWGYSRFGRAGNISNKINYNLQDDLDTESRGSSFLRPAKTTLVMKDSNGNSWIGTNKGYVYLRERNSTEVKRIYFGPPIKNITTLYFDKVSSWWMGDNYFKRTGNIVNRSQSKDQGFLYRWNEITGEWTEYKPSDLTFSIRDININCLLRVDYTLFIGTLKGVITFNILDEKWDLLIDGFVDPAIWDMVRYKDKIYLATARGIQVMSLYHSPLNKSKIPFLQSVSRTEIFDLDIIDHYLYAATGEGIFKVDLANSKSIRISSEVYRSLSAVEGNLLLAKDGLWTVLDNGNIEQIYDGDVFKFAVNGKFIWITNKQEAILFDMEKDKEMTYSHIDGIPGSVIYDIDCDDNWVWFGTDDGMAIYNWSRYHK